MKSFFLVLVLIISAVICSAKWTSETQSASSVLPSTGKTCGGTSPLTRWARTGRSDTIQMNIDTSSCRFEKTPLYFTSLSGVAGHYLLVGVDAIYEPTANGFKINVHSTNNESADTLMAWSAQYQWNVNWFGFSP
ncbi:unnamed protein product [Rotaria sp. Silwood1]|nr:unnamed protein product [Rotaria sp. Silwood1]CAF1277856.1 unnamed protein product [Rotaria sp. Silwood1]CAF1279681.1 unnamed protein product [Rotaria sp. Silwood1]CAF3477517.1 unnamed protein product [Rotaria sp. Silwood1]CAF3524005.1 unnamed protein product [Rotaria sp. Silwood1]